VDNNWAKAAMLAGILVPFLAKAQQSCRDGIRIEGTVTDVTGAVIPRAAIDSGKGQKATTDSMGNNVLAEAGYSSLVSEYDLRFTNTQTLAADLLHETRIGFSWKRTEQTPLSSTPSLQIAGYFTDGGVNFYTDAGTPQTSYTNQEEFARPDWQSPKATPSFPVGSSSRRSSTGAALSCETR
jgi:hypothetical protein